MTGGQRDIVADELAARRAQREDDPELAALSALRGEPLRVAVAEHIERQQDITDRLGFELGRLGNGCVALRDKWAASDDPALNEAARELNDLLCGR